VTTTTNGQQDQTKGHAEAEMLSGGSEERQISQSGAFAAEVIAGGRIGAGGGGGLGEQIEDTADADGRASDVETGKCVIYDDYV
jgi:hypothetical protein